MMTAPITVGIPTFARGLRLQQTLERLAACTPAPAEIIVHVDGSDGELERVLQSQFPKVRLLSSRQTVGPGGGRHRCIQAATHPFFVSFDDDSWPVDSDFFDEVMALFERHPRAAVLAASIYHPHESQPARTDDVMISTDYTGCGYAIRTEAYFQTTGHIDRTPPYGIEEVDVAMQLHALGWAILKSGGLRVFHETQLSHHDRADVVAGTLQNVALRAFLRYPVILWPRALLQLGNAVLFMISRGRFNGLGRGLLGIPSTLMHYSPHRRRLPTAKIRSYLRARPKSVA